MVLKLASILKIYFYMAILMSKNFFNFQGASQRNTLIPYRHPQYAVKIFYLFFFKILRLIKFF